MFLDGDNSRAGNLSTPHFIPLVFQEVDILHGNLPVMK